MAISASQIATTNTLEQFRTEFNILRDDVSGLEDGSVTFSEISATTLGSSTINVQEDGTIVFEGATDNANETTLTVIDPTGDHTIVFPDQGGLVSLIGGIKTNADDDIVLDDVGSRLLLEDVMDGDTGSFLSSHGVTFANNDVSLSGKLVIGDGETIGSTSDTDSLSISSTGVVNFTQRPTFAASVTIQDGGSIGSSSDLNAVTISSGGVVAVTATTANTSSTDGALTVAGGVGIAADLSVGDTLTVAGTNGVTVSQGSIKLKNGGTQSRIDFYCESSNAHYARLQAPAHSAFSGNVTLTLPATTDTIAGIASSQTLTNKTLTSPVLNTGLSGSAFLDEDDLASNSATKVASQQSIKAYVDNRDLDAATDSGTIDIDLGSETLTIAGGEGIDTSASGTTITITGEEATASNKGVASFSSNDFSVSSGAVTIKSSGITNTQLAGSIADSKLDQITTAGKVALSSLEIDGGTDIGADLVNADEIIVDDGGGGTNRRSDLTRVKKYIYSAMSGDATATDSGDLTIANTSVTNAMLAGSIANAKLANSSITVTDGSSSTAASLGSTITFSGTNNEVEVGESSGTITIGLPDDVTIGDSLTVTGNLTVSGTTTQTGAVTSNDNFNILSNNNTGSSTDFGLAGKYVESSTTKYAGIFFDASADNTFRFFADTQTEPSTTVNISATGYAAANLVVGTLTAAGVTIGSAVISEAELEIIDGATITTTELNLLDGDTSVGSSITLIDGDGFVVNDGGAMKTIPASDLLAYTANDATALAIALG